MKQTIEIKGITFELADVLADRLGVTTDLLWRLHRANKIPQPIKLGKRAYYPSDGVEDALLRSASAVTEGE